MNHPPPTSQNYSLTLIARSATQAPRSSGATSCEPASLAAGQSGPNLLIDCLPHTLACSRHSLDTMTAALDSNSPSKKYTRELIKDPQAGRKPQKTISPL
jgi:hypothetical protein